MLAKITMEIFVMIIVHLRTWLPRERGRTHNPGMVFDEVVARVHSHHNHSTRMNWDPKKERLTPDHILE